MFEFLKEMLTSTPVLKVPDPEGPFVVVTDTLGEGIGGLFG